jgi:hypothetical protein
LARPRVFPRNLPTINSTSASRVLNSLTWFAASE